MQELQYTLRKLPKHCLRISFLVAAADSVELLVDVEPHYLAVLAGSRKGNSISLAEIHVDRLIIVLALLRCLANGCVRSNAA